MVLVEEEIRTIFDNMATGFLLDRDLSDLGVVDLFMSQFSLDNRRCNFRTSGIGNCVHGGVHMGGMVCR